MDSPSLPPSSVSQLKRFDREKPSAFESVLLVRRIAVKMAKNGSEYLSVELADKTGSFHATCFGDSAAFQYFQDIPEGAVARVQGVTGYYQERFSPKISEAEKCDPDTLPPTVLDQLVDKSLEDPDALWEELQTHIQAIANPQLRETVLNALNELGDRFKFAPGGIVMHHAYRAGLMEHTVHILRAAKAILPFYAEVNSDLAVAGIILHDTGKAIEYEGQLSYRKSKEGLLHGHVVIGYRLTRKAGIKAGLAPELLERLEHIILSHQGELEWGAAVLPATPEAVFVSMIDNLDAKMGMVQKALQQTPETERFSDYLPGLRTKPLVTPLPS